MKDEMGHDTEEWRRERTRRRFLICIQGESDQIQSRLEVSQPYIRSQR